VKKSHRSAVLLVLKLVVAISLLAWVASKVHWRDYVTAKGGGEWAVLEVQPNWDAPATLTVSQGELWWKKVDANRPATDFEVSKQTLTLRQLGLQSTLAAANVPLFILVLAGYILSLAIIGVRWWFLLRIQEIHVRLWEAMKLTFLGQFYNTVVPGTVGGDLVKGYYIATHTPKKAGALLSIVVDRVLGFAELALLAGVMLLVVWLGNLARLEQIEKAGIAVMVFVVGVTGVMTFTLSPGFRRVFRLQKIYQRLPFARHLAAAGEAADLYRHRIGGLAKAIGMTFGAQIIWICCVGLLGYALHLPTPFHIYLVFVPVIYLCAAFLPTPGGFGPVEFFYCYFLATGGFCTASQAIALALLARLMDIGRGLPGLWVVITGPRLPKTGAMEAELKQVQAESGAAPAPSDPPRG
jgi:uncharacterized protein (TIRG00374 family)